MYQGWWPGPDFARFSSTLRDVPPCSTTVAVAVGVVGPKESVVWSQRLDLVLLQQGQTAEYKPRPLLICILASAIVLHSYVF